MSVYTNVEQKGNRIYFRGRKRDGSRISEMIDYKPYLFVDDKKGGSKFRTVIGSHPVSKLDFDSIYDAREYIKKYSDVSNFEWYGSERWLYNFINDRYPSETVEHNFNHLKIGYLDIEVKSDSGFPEPSKAQKEVTAITLSDGHRFYTFGCKDYTPSAADVEYVKCKNEADLLLKFLDKWRGLDLDIISGWNSSGFDLPYLYNRISNVIGEQFADKLSPWGIVTLRDSFDRIGRATIATKIFGISNLDYYNLYQKFTYSKQEQYSLGYIAKQELGDDKLGYLEYGSLDNLYESDFQKYIDYNIKDVRLVVALEAKMKLIEQAVSIAYSAKINYEDSMTSVLLWDVIMHNFLMARHLVVPRQRHSHKDEQIAGAFVKDPIPGLYNWVVTFDASSLYPSLIQQLNISPEKFRGMLFEMTPAKMLDKTAWENDSRNAQEQGISVAGNGAAYDVDSQGFIPALMEKYFEDRARFANEMIECQKLLQTDPNNQELQYKIVQLNNNQMARKIALNSCYGAMTNPGFRYYSNELAESITLSGQVVAQWAQMHVNEFLNTALKTNNVDYVIASDTDSIMINLEILVKQSFDGKQPTIKEVVLFLDKFAKNCLSVVLDRAFEDLARRMNALKQKVNMKREAIADKAIWTGGKRYVMQIWDNKGVVYEKPKLKIMGIESVRSSTPTICRKAINDAIKIILTGSQSELKKFLSEFRKEFDAANLSDISRNSSVKKLAHYAKVGKGIPIAVCSALNFNSLIKKMNLEQKYPLIEDGYKVKFVQLKQPNKYHIHVFGFPAGILPKELSSEFESLVDRDLMFETTFLEPIKKLADVCNLQVVETSTLEDFFS